MQMNNANESKKQKNKKKLRDEKTNICSKSNLVKLLD
jgi:hypothetical protein